MNYGGTAEGAGTYGAVKVTTGGIVHPGTCPGSVTTANATWGGGGAYQFDIDDATGAAGVNFSQWVIDGGLSITSGPTANSVFTVDVNLLAAADTLGLLPDFDPARSYGWEIATTTGGVDWLTRADLAVDTRGFENAYTGAFGLSSDWGNV